MESSQSQDSLFLNNLRVVCAFFEIFKAKLALLRKNKKLGINYNFSDDIEEWDKVLLLRNENEENQESDKIKELAN